MDKKIMVSEKTHKAVKIAAAREGVTLSDWADAILAAAALKNGRKA
jgi:predicted HicB family RNase H-like nuclease